MIDEIGFVYRPPKSDGPLSETISNEELGIEFVEVQNDPFGLLSKGQIMQVIENLRTDKREINE